MANNKSDPSKKFHGKPCKSCGGTLRYISGPCVPCMARNHKRWRNSDPKRIRKSLREYNRKRENLPEPTRLEPHACECCGEPPKDQYALNLDHCHKTGKFRGWLCRRCNMGIGQMGDTWQHLLNAYNYLIRAEMQ